MHPDERLIQIAAYAGHIAGVGGGRTTYLAIRMRQADGISVCSPLQEEFFNTIHPKDAMRLKDAASCSFDCFKIELKERLG